MSKIKVEARENVIIRSERERLEAGNTMIIENPSKRAMDELDTHKNRGNIRYTVLEEKTVKTVENEEVQEIEEKDEEEEDNVETLYDESDNTEISLDDDRFDCEICGRTHYTDSKIGKEHLKEMLENEN